MKGEPSGFWGKLSQLRDEWHPLVDHCADVAACLEALLSRSVLRRRLARLGGKADLSSTQVARLSVLGAWHDVGKFNWGFQAKARPGSRQTAGHVAEVLALFGTPSLESERLGIALGIESIGGWGEGPGTIYDLLVAAIAHHGRPVGIDQESPRPAFWAPSNDLDPFVGIAGLVSETRRWFPEAFVDGVEPLPALPAFHHAFSGLVTLADWLGSDSDFFRFSEPGDPDRMAFARKIAGRVMVESGLDSSAPRLLLGDATPGFDRVSPFSARAAQQCVLNLPATGEPSLTILEAETGSGKTEAALARFMVLFHAGAVDGLYFALPTRTAATQIHHRVVQAVARAFPSERERPPVVLAVPGYLAVDDKQGRRLPGFEVLWNDDDVERWRYRGWAAENSKRYLAGAVVVGTIDQVLLSSLAVGHSHLRAACLLRHFLVVDEVHASDAYMNRLLEEALSRHRAAGGHAFLMSATLGSAARSRFMKAGLSARSLSVEVPFEAGELPYPVVTHWREDLGVSCVEVPDEGRARRVAVSLAGMAADPEAIARRALSAARAGARVLVLRNTVRDCLATQMALEDLASASREEDLLFSCAGSVAAHHARFAREDRIALDEAIEMRLGKGSAGGNVVAIATQTVQQSLDLDADLLLTDLCPMDVLLQRIGRLHRHRDRARPLGFEDPLAIVLTPTDRDLGRLIGKDGQARGAHGFGFVYEDLRILEATWLLLEKGPVIEIPGDCRAYVEATTHPEALTAITRQLGELWPSHEQAVLGVGSSHRRLAHLNLANWDATFCDQAVLFPSRELERRIQTRLGLGDRLACFDPPIRGPFGRLVTTLTIPAHFAAGMPADARPEQVEANLTGTQFLFGARVFRYDRLGLRPVTQPVATANPEEELADA